MLYYVNNQYVYIENILQNIKNIENINIAIDKNNKLINDLDVYERNIIYYDNKDEIMIKEEIEENEKIQEPNILILYSKYDQNYNFIKEDINFDNIYYSVKILITDEKVINNRWQEIPETIEYIIIKSKSNIENNRIMNYSIKNTKIYKNDKNKFDFIKFNDDKEKKIIIRELIEEKRINEYNIDGYSVLYLCCQLKMKEEVMEIIKLVDNEMINKIYCKLNYYYNDDDMIIDYLCSNNWKDIIINNIEKFIILNKKNEKILLAITEELLVLEDKAKIKIWLKNTNKSIINKKILNLYSNNKIKEDMIQFLINELDNKEYKNIN